MLTGRLFFSPEAAFGLVRWALSAPFHQDRRPCHVGEKTGKHAGWMFTIIETSNYQIVKPYLGCCLFGVKTLAGGLSGLVNEELF